MTALCASLYYFRDVSGNETIHGDTSVESANVATPDKTGLKTSASDESAANAVNNTDTKTNASGAEITHTERDLMSPASEISGSTPAVEEESRHRSTPAVEEESRHRSEFEVNSSYSSHSNSQSNEVSVGDGTGTGIDNANLQNNTGKTNTASAAENKPEQNSILSGFVICIDPGHQQKGNYEKEPIAPGSDDMKTKCSSGTQGVKTRIPEYKLNLAVSLKLQKYLEELGAEVVMTRTVNEVNISNAERAQKANDSNADLYLRIHADGSTNKSVQGVSVLIPSSGSITDKSILDRSKAAGDLILQHFVKATEAKSRGVIKRSDLSGFNWCSRPMVLVEMGFMSNPQEDELLSSEAYQEKMVRGIANGIVEYCKSQR